MFVHNLFLQVHSYTGEQKMGNEKTFKRKWRILRKTLEIFSKNNTCYFKLPFCRFLWSSINTYFINFVCK